MSIEERGGRGNTSTPSRTARGPRDLRVVHGQARPKAVPAMVRRRRRVAVAIMAIIALGLMTYILLGPVTRLIESRRNLAVAEDQLAEERSRTRVLEDRKAWGATERFVEMEARRMGYVRPGEIPIIVLDHHEEEDAPGNADDNSSP